MKIKMSNSVCLALEGARKMFNYLLAGETQWAFGELTIEEIDWNPVLMSPKDQKERVFLIKTNVIVRGRDSYPNAIAQIAVVGGSGDWAFVCRRSQCHKANLFGSDAGMRHFYWEWARNYLTDDPIPVK